MNLEDTMADTALKFGPEWLRALTEPQGGTDGGGENSDSSIINSLHLMLTCLRIHPFPGLDTPTKIFLPKPIVKMGPKLEY